MLAFLIVCTFAIYFALWAIYTLIKARLSPLAKIPGYPLYNPITGNLWTLNHHKIIFDRWRASYLKFGTIYRWVSVYARLSHFQAQCSRMASFRWYTVMGHTYISVTSPDYIKHILVSNSRKYGRGTFASVEIFRKIVGDHSMLLINGDKHRRHRSIVSPAFRIGNLRKLIPVMHECSMRLCDYFDSLLEAGGHTSLNDVHIRQHLSHATLTVIGLAGFGFNFDCIDKKNRLAEAVSSLNGSRTQQGFLQMLPYSYYYPFPSTRTFWSCLWTIHSIIDDLVKSKRGLKKHGAGYADKDLLDMILEHTDKELITDQNRNALSERELRDEVMTFILAGHETTSLALTWTIAMLCVHEEWQDRCRQEIAAVLENEQSITWDHLDQLKVTSAVVHETMRLWPPIPVVSRTAMVDDQIGPYHIPAGTNIVAVIGQMHRLPEYWPNPTEFLPERFLEGDVAWEAYMPFADGPHKCLGYQFAMSEIMVMLATLLKKYKFTLAMDWEKLKVQGLITLQPLSPIMVNMKRV